MLALQLIFFQLNLLEVFTHLDQCVTNLLVLRELELFKEPVDGCLFNSQNNVLVFLFVK
jgi:hypothetical protein